MTNNKIENRLWAITKPINLYINSAILLASLSSILTIFSFILMAYITTFSFHEGNSFLFINLNFNNTFILLAIVSVFSFILRKYSFIISHLGAFKLENILRTKLSIHISELPLGFITSTGTGKLKKVLLEDVKNLHAFVADTTPMIGRSFTTPIVSLVLIFIIDYRLAIASLSILVLGIIVMSLAMKDSEVNRIKYEKSQSNINKSVVEFVQAMPIVKIFDDGTTSFKRYNDSLSSYKKNLKKWIDESGTAGKIAIAILSPMPTILTVSLAGIYFVLNDTLTLLPFITILLISTGMSDALMPLMWMSNFIKKSQAAANRIYEIIEVKPLSYNKKENNIKNTDIHFKNVSFKYENRDSLALSNINFTIKEKTTTAIIGESGAGKSTIARLFPRFWDIQEGEITIGDTNLKDINSTTLMNTISFVFQDTYLFHTSIKDNLKIAKKTASMEDIITACKAAQIHDFISSLPEGYNTIVGDRGAVLSGGQKQRITIARAILRDSKIIILDEITSYADAENEEKLINALSNLTKNKTVLIIAHRLSTIINANEIILLEKGKLIAKGKHEILIKDSIKYKNLYSSYIETNNWDIKEKGLKDD